jgi:hypothetical protein
MTLSSAPPPDRGKYLGHHQPLGIRFRLGHQGVVQRRLTSIERLSVLKASAFYPHGWPDVPEISSGQRGVLGQQTSENVLSLTVAEPLPSAELPIVQEQQAQPAQPTPLPDSTQMNAQPGAHSDHLCGHSVTPVPQRTSQTAPDVPNRSDQPLAQEYQEYSEGSQGKPSSSGEARSSGPEKVGQNPPDQVTSETSDLPVQAPSQSSTPSFRTVLQRYFSREQSESPIVVDEDAILPTTQPPDDRSEEDASQVSKIENLETPHNLVPPSTEGLPTDQTRAAESHAPEIGILGKALNNLMRMLSAQPPAQPNQPLQESIQHPSTHSAPLDQSDPSDVPQAPEQEIQHHDDSQISGINALVDQSQHEHIYRQNTPDILTDSPMQESGADKPQPLDSHGQYSQADESQLSDNQTLDDNDDQITQLRGPSQSDQANQTVVSDHSIQRDGDGDSQHLAGNSQAGVEPAAVGLDGLQVPHDQRQHSDSHAPQSFLEGPQQGIGDYPSQGLPEPPLQRKPVQPDSAPESLPLEGSIQRSGDQATSLPERPIPDPADFPVLESAIQCSEDQETHLRERPIPDRSVDLSQGLKDLQPQESFIQSDGDPEVLRSESGAIQHSQDAEILLPDALPESLSDQGVQGLNDAESPLLEMTQCRSDNAVLSPESPIQESHDDQPQPLEDRLRQRQVQEPPLSANLDQAIEVPQSLQAGIPSQSDQETQTPALDPLIQRDSDGNQRLDDDESQAGVAPAAPVESSQGVDCGIQRRGKDDTQLLDSQLLDSQLQRIPDPQPLSLQNSQSQNPLIQPSRETEISLAGRASQGSSAPERPLSESSSQICGDIGPESLLSEGSSQGIWDSQLPRSDSLMQGNGDLEISPLDNSIQRNSDQETRHPDSSLQSQTRGDHAVLLPGDSGQPDLSSRLNDQRQHSGSHAPQSFLEGPQQGIGDYPSQGLPEPPLQRKPVQPDSAPESLPLEGSIQCEEQETHLQERPIPDRSVDLSQGLKDLQPQESFIQPDSGPEGPRSDSRAIQRSRDAEISLPDSLPDHGVQGLNDAESPLLDITIQARSDNAALSPESSIQERHGDQPRSLENRIQRRPAQEPPLSANLDQAVEVPQSLQIGIPSQPDQETQTPALDPLSQRDSGGDQRLDDDDSQAGVEPETPGLESPQALEHSIQRRGTEDTQRLDSQLQRIPDHPPQSLKDAQPQNPVIQPSREPESLLSAGIWDPQLPRSDSLMQGNGDLEISPLDNSIQRNSDQEIRHPDSSLQSQTRGDHAVLLPGDSGQPDLSSRLNDQRQHSDSHAPQSFLEGPQQGIGDYPSQGLPEPPLQRKPVQPDSAPESLPLEGSIQRSGDQATSLPERPIPDPADFPVLESAIQCSEDQETHLRERPIPDRSVDLSQGLKDLQPQESFIQSDGDPEVLRSESGAIQHSQDAEILLPDALPESLSDQGVQGLNDAESPLLEMTQCRSDNAVLSPESPIQESHDDQPQPLEDRLQQRQVQEPPLSANLDQAIEVPQSLQAGIPSRPDQEPQTPVLGHQVLVRSIQGDSDDERQRLDNDESQAGVAPAAPVESSQGVDRGIQRRGEDDTQLLDSQLLDSQLQRIPDPQPLSLQNSQSQNPLIQPSRETEISLAGRASQGSSDPEISLSDHSIQRNSDQETWYPDSSLQSQTRDDHAVLLPEDSGQPDLSSRLNDQRQRSGSHAPESLEGPLQGINDYPSQGLPEPPLQRKPLQPDSAPEILPLEGLVHRSGDQSISLPERPIPDPVDSPVLEGAIQRSEDQKTHLSESDIADRSADWSQGLDDLQSQESPLQPNRDLEFPPSDRGVIRLRQDAEIAVPDALPESLSDQGVQGLNDAESSLLESVQRRGDNAALSPESSIEPRSILRLPRVLQNLRVLKPLVSSGFQDAPLQARQDPNTRNHPFQNIQQNIEFEANGRLGQSGAALASLMESDDGLSRSGQDVPMAQAQSTDAIQQSAAVPKSWSSLADLFSQTAGTTNGTHPHSPLTQGSQWVGARSAGNANTQASASIETTDEDKVRSHPLPSPVPTGSVETAAIQRTLDDGWVHLSRMDDADDETSDVTADETAKYLELLAQEMYGRLKQRLVIERERQGSTYPRRW